MDTPATRSIGEESAMAHELKITNEDADKIDAYLGAGTYDRWDVLDSEGRTQLGKKKQVDNALWKAAKDVYAVLSPYGTDYTEKVREDLIAGFELLLASKYPAPDPYHQLLDIYEVALDTADLLIQEAEAVPVVSVILGAASVKTAGLALLARRLQEELVRLDRLIFEAMAQKVEAQIQQALSFATATISLLNPGLGLLAKGSLTLGDFLLDDQLGPDKPAVEDVAGNSAKGVGFVLDVMEKIESLDKHKKIIQVGGKTLIVVGFYFDYREVQLASKNLDAVQKKMEECKKIHGELVVKLPRERVDRLVGDGVAGRFDPRGDGRLMKEWATVPVRHRRRWSRLADEALAFVGAEGAGPGAP